MSMIGITNRSRLMIKLFIPFTCISSLCARIKDCVHSKKIPCQSMGILIHKKPEKAVLASKRPMCFPSHNPWHSGKQMQAGDLADGTQKRTKHSCGTVRESHPVLRDPALIIEHFIVECPGMSTYSMYENAFDYNESSYIRPLFFLRRFWWFLYFLHKKPISFTALCRKFYTCFRFCAF